MAKYVVSETKLLTPTIFQVTVTKKDKGGVFDFIAGQYAALSFIKKGRPTPTRCFSISSAPSEKDKLEFSMRVKGRYTTAMSQIKKGDIVEVTGPFGGFVINPYEDKQATFIAGGIGITPFMSMLKEATLTNSNQKATLIYSVQTQEETAFVDELKQIVEKNKNIRIIVAVNAGDTTKLKGLEVVNGRIDGTILDSLISNQYQTDTFFMCGPPGFMSAMRSTLRSKGVDEYRIITEAFSQGSKNQSEKLLSWPANMYALSAVGLIVAMLIIAVTDIVGSLPKTNKTTNSSGGFTSQQQVDSAISSTPPQITPTTTTSTPASSPIVSTPRTVTTPTPRTTVS